MTDFTPNLLSAQSLLAELLAHIRNFDVDRLLYHAPIEDRIRFESWKQDEVMGLKKLVDSVEHHKRQIDSLVDSKIPPQDDPLPSVLGLVTFWKIVITAEPPIVGVRMGMYPSSSLTVASAGAGAGINESGAQGKGKGKGKSKEKEIWVDVIARGGREWIRIYSKKISHLLAEFREADSYINSDYDSDSDYDSGSAPDARGNGNGNGNDASSSSRPGLSNSLVTTARELQHAANTVERIPGAPAPSLTIHLTRLPRSPSLLNDGDDESDEWPDSRIPESFELIKRMDINLVFGDLSSVLLDSPRLHGPPIPSAPIAGMRFNLDITTLMGLCSDVLHHPLPTTHDEAKKRSLRPRSQVSTSADHNTAARGRDGTGRGNGKGRKEEDEDEDPDLKGQSQNSRELYRCILEEMARPFVQEFNDVIKNAWARRRPGAKNPDARDEESDSIPVEFWTTRQAAQYTYEALSSGPAHGHGGEQRRMRRMLGYEEGDFFEGSRYEGDEGVLKGFKVKIFDDESLEGSSGETFGTNGTADPTLKTGFHHTLEAITSTFLDEYYRFAANSTLSTDTETNTTGTKARSKASASSSSSTTLPSFLQPKKMPAPPVAKISLPFPVVSLHSLHRGAKEGMTTVMMGTATLKEVWAQSRWRTRGWERGYYVRSQPCPADSTEAQADDAELEHAAQEADQAADVGEAGEAGPTAVIIFPYRVFGEGKRVRFEQGDWSYPSRE